MKRNIKGISLIVLVITIIVMIIIAGTIIISSRNNNAIRQGKIAVNLTNIKAAEEAANYAMSDCIVHTLGQATDADLQEAVDTALNNSGYMGTVINKKVIVEKAANRDFVIKIDVRENQVNRPVLMPVVSDEWMNSYFADIDEYEPYINVPLDFTLDYGDGSTPLRITTNPASYLTHTYTQAGEYTLTFSGRSVPFAWLVYLEDPETEEEVGFSASLITEIVSWGNVGLKAFIVEGDHLYTSYPKPNACSFKDLEMMISTEANADLTSIPNGFFKNASKLKDVSYFFSDTSITSIPANLFSGCTSLENVTGTFDNCDSLTEIPESLFQSCNTIKNLSCAFAECNSLESIPQDLLNNCNNIESLEYAFSSCHNLTGNAPEWWNIYSDGVGKNCFGGSTRLNNYGVIPTAWKQNYYR